MGEDLKIKKQRSSRAAGKRFEDRCAKFLRSLGWTVDKARAAVKFIGPGRFVSSANDFLGCADLLCVHPEKPYTLFVQCTRGSGIGQKKKDLEAVPWNLNAQRVQVWQPMAGTQGGIRVLTAFPGEWMENFFRMATGTEPGAEVLP